jgi:hypothetical protein
MCSAIRPLVSARSSAMALAILLGALGFAGRADAQQALSPYMNYHRPIQLVYTPPCNYSWVAHPNPYCTYGISGPTDNFPARPVSGVPLPPFCPCPYGCQCPPSWCERCWNKCFGWCKGPPGPYGYAPPAGYVRSPRDFFMQNPY